MHRKNSGNEAVAECSKIKDLEAENIVHLHQNDLPEWLCLSSGCYTNMICGMFLDVSRSLRMN